MLNKMKINVKLGLRCWSDCMAYAISTVRTNMEEIHHLILAFCELGDMSPNAFTPSFRNPYALTLVRIAPRRNFHDPP